jgi:hypothetical protein
VRPASPPTATSATPTNDRPLAIQSRRESRSIPNPNANSAVTIGSVPKISAVVEALVRSIAYTNDSWFR